MSAGAAAAFALASAAFSAVDGYYGAKSQQYALRGRALTLDYQAGISRINAQLASQQASEVMRLREKRLMMTGLQYAQAEGARKARTAARGVQAGVGSAGEIAASLAFAKETDRLEINSASVREKNAARRAMFSARAQGALASVAARSSRDLAGAISPWGSAAMAFGSSLLNSGSMMAMYSMGGAQANPATTSPSP